MALFNPTFIFGLVVLLYLCSFVVFAILRILTGISIQRIGYFSLRRIAYTPRDGLKIEIRGLGLNLHRPTFAQPTWISVVLSELAVTIDPNIAEKLAGTEHSNGVVEEPQTPTDTETDEPELKRKLSRSASFKPQRSKSWEHLTSLKERIKRLHRNVNWIRMLDVVATNSTVTLVDVGQIQVGSFTMAVDTRRKMVDRARMFLHQRPAPDQRPAEWMFTLRSVLFTPEGRDSLEVLDHAALDIHGLLFKDLDGLRDAAISLKLGRIHIPYDDISACMHRYRATKSTNLTTDEKEFGEIGMADLFEELDRPGSRDEKLVQTVSDSKEFVGSVLRGIKEVQFAVSYIGFTKKISSIRPQGRPLYVNASMKEVGVDLHRLDPKSPAHRMYFSSKDIAHQALVAALSIGVSVDDGHGTADRLMYIPMATTTVRTTLPSKTVEFVGDSSAAERNANIMFANIVITSPSIDLDPKHLPIVLALLNSRKKVTTEPVPGRHHHLISRLLPKANVKFSMHEPVMRIALPPVEKDAEEDDFDLIISSISSVSLDIESSHSAVGRLHYSILSTMRVQSHDLYYQTSSGERYDLLQTESLELKVHVSANPEVYVVATCNLQTFSIHMVRPEISDGVRQIVRQLRLNVQPELKSRKTSRDPNFVRALPPWLVHFQFHGSDFSVEVAGIDEDISSDTRGIALQLEHWTAEYLAQRPDSNTPGLERRSSRRRTNSRSLVPDPEVIGRLPQSPARKLQSKNATDGRRLAVHVRGLEGFVVESCEKWEPEPFIAMPRFEVALSTSSDSQGPIFHVNSVVRTLHVQYSLYRHYAFGIAVMVLRKAFVRTKADVEEAEKARDIKILGRDYLSPQIPSSMFADGEPDNAPGGRELVVVDFRSTLLQVKAKMPADPPTMLQIYGLEAGKHRFSAPFLHAKLARLYAEAPRMKRVWARIVSIKSMRIDLRETRRKYGTGEMLDEKLIDVNTEAIRLAIPHQLVLYKVTDNFINTIKSVEQLHHRFITGTNEYILEKRPEGPKKVPKMSIRSKALLFELEDGAFEWKLGNIYRTGLIEQRQRLAREQAFKCKARRVEEEEQRRDGTRFRNRSAHPRGRSTHNDPSNRRSKSADSRHRSQSHRGRTMRYDPEGTSGMTGSAKISIKEAHERLQKHNSQSWKKRIDAVFDQSTQNMEELRGVFWGPDELPDDLEEEENILQVPQRPALMTTLISDLRIMLDKPSFPIGELPQYLHKIGKGMPLDMKYTLLIPTHIQIDMGEARVTLRDYPLPLLHVPAIQLGQSPRIPSWSLKTDFIIAEEFRGSESTRRVKVAIVPAADHGPDKPKTGGFFIDVRRTVAPVKCYSDISIDINTSLPTRITWGSSYQPAIQDMMMIFESFTKPQIDPSDRAGFWDKIRLSFHSRVGIAWKGDGDVHLMLKGTRDPYMITGSGAGLLMCWRNDVRWNICRDLDPRKFMTVDSGEYILAVPDYSHQARVTDVKRQGHDDDSVTSDGSFKHGVVFKKVAMKLSGNVQWVAGLMFERDTDVPGQRSFNFEPHYNVVLKEPRFAKAPPGLAYDAFRGFRSNYIHLSIAVKAPVNRDWDVSNMKPSKSYNTVHLTPRFFTHFFDWWGMFNGTMSLPIRQGSLWPGLEKSSKKFGRHLATIKYSLLLAPLFVSHVYKHKDAEDYAEDVVSATGLKMRLDSFMLDVHQRREHFPTQDKGKKTQGKTSAMKMHEAQLDLLSADIRAVSASIAGTTPEDLQQASSPLLSSQQEPAALDLSHFEIPDNDFSWIDMDDFVELDWILPSKANPETKIMPLAFAPRFTYFRQTDHGDSISGDPDRTSAFGNEPTHFCTMSKDDDPRRVQCELIQRRLDQLQKQMRAHRKSIGDAELRIIKDDMNASFKDDFHQMHQHGNHLQDKKIFLESMMHRMSMRVNTNNKNAVPDGDADVDSDEHSPRDDENPAPDFASDFNNRFVIHNMQMKWNNLLRNIILRYIHQVSQRRGFVYYLSRRAVKFILDIVEEQNKAKSAKASGYTTNGTRSTSASTSPINDDLDAAQEVEDRINEILSDGKNFVNANDELEQEAPQRISGDNPDGNISEEFSPQNSYHLRLIAPQIQLQSEKNAKDAALLTAKGMELKVIEVMDKDRIFDDVSGLVQRRFSVEMDSTQFFVTHEKWFSSQLLSLYSGSHYGAPAGSSWPPWVPMEVMFDFKVDPFGFQRVVQKTSASLRYDKYNTLRLKYGDDVNGEGSQAANPENVESRMDHLWVEFPQVRAICDSSQYYALYIIVLDLLMYSEPLEKTRSERLEKIMLASDFSDLRGAPEMVIRLQEQIKQLDELKTQFQINSKYLDQRGWEDRFALDRDLTSCEDELFFMMKAITTSQRKYEGTQTSGLLRWNISSESIVWHLIRGNNEPLMEFQLQNAEYDRTDNSDGSHINSVRIGKIIGLNLLPDAIYPEMIAPYTDAERGAFADGGNQQMLRVYWYMLEAIAGIPVMDHFEVNLFPMKIQLEREVGKKLFEYIFPDSKEDKHEKSDKHDKHDKHGAAKGKSPLVLEQTISSESTDEGRRSESNMLMKEKGSSTRTGSLELRLKPTMNSEQRPKAGAVEQRPKPVSYHSSFGPAAPESHHRFKLFSSATDKPSTTPRTNSSKALNKKGSSDSLQSLGLLSRPSMGRSGTHLSPAESSSTASGSKLFAIKRANSKKKQKQSDDLTKMMDRASNYMTLAYVKIPSVVLCLSYKGKGERNIEDVHDFVFRLPMIEYRNKTWSNLDLALALKKDVIRALISHTGAIIGNKFSKHRPNATQQHRLRELATSSTLLTPTHYDSSNDNSDTSTFASSPIDSRNSDPRRSFASSLNRPSTASNSVASLHSNGRPSTMSSGLAMTPSNNGETGSIADSERSGSRRGKDEEKHGFMANTIGLFKKSNTMILGPDDSKDDSEDAGSTRRKSKLLLGKKILSRGDH